MCQYSIFQRILQRHLDCFLLVRSCRWVSVIPMTSLVAKSPELPSLMPHALLHPPHLRPHLGLHCTALGVADLLSAACSRMPRPPICRHRWPLRSLRTQAVNVESILRRCEPIAKIPHSPDLGRYCIMRPMLDCNRENHALSTKILSVI